MAQWCRVRPLAGIAGESPAFQSLKRCDKDAPLWEAIAKSQASKNASPITTKTRRLFLLCRSCACFVRRKEKKHFVSFSFFVNRCGSCVFGECFCVWFKNSVSFGGKSVFMEGRGGFCMK